MLEFTDMVEGELQGSCFYYYYYLFQTALHILHINSILPIVVKIGERRYWRRKCLLFRVQQLDQCLLAAATSPLLMVQYRQRVQR